MTQTAPEERVARPTADSACWIRRAVIVTVGIGLAWRLVRYLGQFPIWGDEAMLLLNILERDYAGLMQHLRFAQVAPLLFLWQEKTALLLLGPSEWSVHLCPFIAGLAALAMFWHTCRSAFSPTVAGLALAILAVAYYPVRHACEVKPYAFDLLYSAAYAWLTIGWLRRPAGGERWLIGLALLTPIAVFSSYPSVFVGGAVSLVLLPSMRQASWAERGWYGAFNVLLVASFVVHFGMVGHQQIDAAEAERTREFLRTYWKDAFPPEDATRWPLWLVRVFTGNMLAYPIGANHGGSTLTFLLVVVGSIALWRGRQHALLALCWLPFALNLVAALLNRYPFGDSARITLHLAPFICILMAHGIAQTLAWVPSTPWRSRLHLATLACLFGCGLIGVVRDLATPFKTEHDRDVRILAHDITREVAAEEPIVLGHGRDEELLPEFLWYLRTSGARLRWQTEALPATTPSYWQVQCSNEPLADLPARPGWRVERSEARCVPPENKVLPPTYCRWARVVRE